MRLGNLVKKAKVIYDRRAVERNAGILSAAAARHERVLIASADSVHALRRGPRAGMKRVTHAEIGRRPETASGR